MSGEEDLEFVQCHCYTEVYLGYCKMSKDIWIIVILINFITNRREIWLRIEKNKILWKRVFRMRYV